MQENSVMVSIDQLKQALEENGYSKGRITQFSNTTNQLMKFMDATLCFATGMGKSLPEPGLLIFLKSM